MINFHSFALKIHKLKFNFGKNKSYHKKKTAHRYIATSVLLKPLMKRLIDVMSLASSFQNRFYCRSSPFKNTNNFGSGFRNRLARRIYETKFPTQVSFIPHPSFSVTHIT